VDCSDSWDLGTGQAFCAAPYSTAELKKLDSLLTRATKQAYRLSNSMSTAAAHQDVLKGGLGCYSLEVEYNLISHQNLVRALNDEGVRGVMTRALFRLQKLDTNALNVDYRTVQAEVRPAAPATGISSKVQYALVLQRHAL
jgi:hypothetical protein